MSNDTVIALTATQIQMVAFAGISRHIQFLLRNAKPQYGLAENTRWELQIEGALAEFALSKFLDKHWDGVGKAGGDDLGNEEVRTTKYHNGHLILHPRDKDEKRYWLVTGENGQYVIRGFMYAKEGKQSQYWTEIEKDGRDRSCYKIPQADLTSPYLNE